MIRPDVAGVSDAAGSVGLFIASDYGEVAVVVAVIALVAAILYAGLGARRAAAGRSARGPDLPPYRPATTEFSFERG